MSDWLHIFGSWLVYGIGLFSNIHRLFGEAVLRQVQDERNLSKRSHPGRLRINLRRLVRAETGSASMLTMAFMVLAVPLVVGSLQMSSIISKDSTSSLRNLREHYNAIGAAEYNAYRLAYESGFAGGLTPGVPFTYNINLNGESVTSTITLMSSATGDPPPPRSDNSRKFQTTKTVDISTTTPEVLTTFTYTISIQNRDNQSEKVTKVYDLLPDGFTYVPYSSTGLTNNEPSISGSELRWNLGSGVTLASGETRTLTFQANASVDEGIYCNEAWVNPGGTKTSSGKTAKITVGSPEDLLCPGDAIDLTKVADVSTLEAGTATTVTYTITMDNIGTSDLDVSKIEDLLPPGFTYVSGSTVGDVTTDDPSTQMWQGAQKLVWNLSPKHEVDSGATHTLSFQVTGSVPPGDYLNEVWVSIQQISGGDLYSWPTALIQVMSANNSTSESGGTYAEAEIWAGVDSYTRQGWWLKR